MSENVTNNIDGIEIKDSDLTLEQRHHKNHIISLRNKIAKLQFEIDDLAPSLKWHENAMLETTKQKEDEASVQEK